MWVEVKALPARLLVAVGSLEMGTRWGVAEVVMAIDVEVMASEVEVVMEVLEALVTGVERNAGMELPRLQQVWKLKFKFQLIPCGTLVWKL